MNKVVYRKGREFIQEGNERSRPKPIENLSNNILVKIALIGVSVFLLSNVYRSAIITREKIEISKQAIEQVNELRVENLELALELHSMESKEYLEVQARDRLNLSGNNEYIFVIPESLLEVGKEGINAFLNPPTEEHKSPTYIVWFEFLKNGI